MKKDMTWLRRIGAVLLILIILISTVLWSSLVIWFLWNQVICAIFTSVMPISYWLAIGVNLCLLVISRFIRIAITTKKD